MKTADHPDLFSSAEEAWLWVASFRLAAKGGPVPPRRCCRREDVLEVVDQLYRAGKIDVDDAHVLRVFGDLQRAPEPRRVKEATADARWQRMMGMLGTEFHRRGWLARERPADAS